MKCRFFKKQGANAESIRDLGGLSFKSMYNNVGRLVYNRRYWGDGGHPEHDRGNR